MNRSSTLWKYVTLFIVTLLVFNPEFAELALFIDAIGLEMFLMLMEIQAATILGLLFSNKIKPLFDSVRRYFSGWFVISSWRTTLQDPKLLVLKVPSQAMLMHLLVLSSAMSMAL
jgi:hypothetical protein